MGDVGDVAAKMVRGGMSAPRRRRRRKQEMATIEMRMGDACDDGGTGNRPSR